MQWLNGGALAMDDLLNGCEADPVIDGYAPHRFSGFMPGENDRNLLNADLCVPVGIPSYAVPAPAPPCHLVIGIIFCRSSAKMRRVDACRVIARMQDGKASGDSRPVVQFPRDPMSGDDLPVKAYTSVAIGVLCAGPWPALIRPTFLYLGPESILNRDGNATSWHCGLHLCCDDSYTKNGRRSKSHLM